MTLNLNKRSWPRVVLGDVARHVTDRVDPETSRLTRFLAGEHIGSQDLQIRTWGVIGEDPIGPMFYKRFKPGHVLYMSRRSYLRKTAVPDFEGICGEKTFVLETKNETEFLQRFLPFVLNAERFHEYAIRMSRGSVNPYLNWTDLAAYEFDLPLIDEQERLVDLLWAIEHHRRELISAKATLHASRSLFVDQNLPLSGGMSSLGEVASISSGITLGPSRRAMKLTAPYLRVANVQRANLDLSEIKDIGATEAEIQTRSLKRGDILVVEGHASIEDIGRAAIWDRDESPLYQNHLFRVQANQSHRPDFLLEWINGTRGRAYIRTVAKSTSGLNTINSTALKEMPIPIVTLENQGGLLRDLSVIDNELSALSNELASIMRLRSSTSADIFGGVP